MRKELITMMLALASIGAGAQRMSYAGHCLVPSDSIVKQQVSYTDPGAAGRNVKWDFSSLQPLTDSYILTYKGEIDSLCGHEHRTRYYYRQSETGVWCTGFENSNSYMSYKDSVLELPFPISYGDTVTARFSGTGEHGYGLPLTAEGVVRVSVDATGVLTLPETRLEAVRVRHETEYTEDGDDNGVFTKTSHRWYAKGYRYPVFESVKTVYSTVEGQDSTVFSASFLYSPSMEEQRERERENAQKWFTQEQLSQAEAGEGADITDMELYPNPARESTRLSCDVSRSTTVQVRIYSGGGALVYETRRRAVPGSNAWDIPTAQLNVGTYVLQVTADNTDTPATTVLIKI